MKLKDIFTLSDWKINCKGDSGSVAGICLDMRGLQRCFEILKNNLGRNIKFWIRGTGHKYLSDGHLTDTRIFCRRPTTFAVRYFTGRNCNNHIKWYTKPPKLL